MATLIMTCWAIWKARNDMVWKQLQPSVDRVLSISQSCLHQWLEAQKYFHPSQMFQRGVAYQERWTKPHDGMMKINVDVSVHATENRFGFGCVARDSNGLFLEALCGRRRGKVSAVLGEALSIKEALSWIQRKDWANVIVESDCLVVVHAIQHQVQMFSPLGLIISDCCSFLSSLKNVSIFFVKRSANQVAHFLATAPEFTTDCILNQEHLPALCNSLLLADLA
ncbi:uncharacterized protein LOC133799338 [Humulus lupulus]|uniref:uncharacterized protein LOC133799338 n=1 Tax=Humulus lupulus TaxID=3486 RepID=UPI002B400B72|nr:uncharacterized protein LOC133799338 [Humulus lupulus]